MSDYRTPGVYLEDTPNSSIADSVSTSIGALVGMSRRGKLGVPVLINSWNSFLSEFARGLQTPFMADSFLANAVWGFFQNGGRQLYVMRVAHTGDTTLINNAARATGTFITGTSVVITASDEGTWGNDLRVRIIANSRIPLNFDIIVNLGNDLVERFPNVTNDTTATNYWIDVVNASSRFITAVSGDIAITDENDVETFAVFTGGLDGIDEVIDDDFINALSGFDNIVSMNFISVPGQTSVAMNNAVLAYCEKRGNTFAILDSAESDTLNTLLEKRHAMNTRFGMITDTWVKVQDPLSGIGKIRTCPPCGHVMGAYARVITNRGVWKSPAGTEANLIGVLETVAQRTNNDTDILNEDGVVCLLPKVNFGICIWGARTLSYDKRYIYIAHVLLDMYIRSSLYLSTQPFVFEANTVDTWNALSAHVESFLDTIWKNGGLEGSSSREAYFVKCDADLNTPENVANGILICEVSFRPKGVAEFIVFRFSHQIAA